MSYSNSTLINQSIIEISPSYKHREEKKLNLIGISPPKKRKAFNLDQEIIMDSGSLILLKDVSMQRPVPRFTSHLTPLVRNQTREDSEYKNLTKKNNIDTSLISEYPTRIFTEKELEGRNFVGESIRVKKSTDEEKKEVDIFSENVDIDKEARAKKYRMLINFLDNTYFQCLMFFFIFWALFSDDMRYAGLSTSVDPVFDGISLAALMAFTIEITLNFIARPEYRWTFFFWLDCISTVTMVFDISWINNLINKK